MNKENNEFLVENYKSFCNACWRKYSICSEYIEFEDFRQRVFLRFLRTNAKYDETRNMSKFGFMCLIAKTEAFEVIRYHNTDSRYKDRFRIVPTMNEDEREECNIEDIYCEDYTIIECKELIKTIKSMVSDFQFKILEYKFLLYSNRYISKQLNTSQQNVSAHMTRIRKILTPLFKNQ